MEDERYLRDRIADIERLQESFATVVKNNPRDHHQMKIFSYVIANLEHARQTLLTELLG